MEKHPYLSSKTIQLIVLVSVALATPLTVLLLSERQDVRQRAAEVSPTVALATLAPTSPYTLNPTVYCLGSCPTVAIIEATVAPTASLQTDPTPTMYCLGNNCTTPAVSPTDEVEPTIDPCTESAVAHTKNSDKRGWFQKFWEEFLKMIRSLIPGQPTTPSPEPSPAPTMGISPTEAIEPTIDPCAPTSSVPTEAVSPTETIAPTEAVEPTEDASISATVVPSEAVEPTEDPCLVTTEGTVSVQTWGHEHHKRSNGLISGFIEFFTELIRLIIELVRGGKIPAPQPTPTPTLAPTEPVEPTEAVEPTENPCAPTEAIEPTEGSEPTEGVTPTNEIVPTVEASISATVVPTQVNEPTEAVAPTEEVSISATVAPTVEEITPTEDPCLVTTEGTVSVQTWGHHHHERKHGLLSDFMKFFIELLRLLIELISGGRIPAPTPTPTPSLAPTEGVTPTEAVEPTIDPCSPTEVVEPTEDASISATVAPTIVATPTVTP